LDSTQEQIISLERAMRDFPKESVHKAPVSSTWDPKVPLDEGDCPPRAWYTEQEVFDLEKKSVFSNKWQPVGPAKVEKPGAYFTGSFLGLQFVVTRTLEGELKAYSNTCRHKGTVIAQGEGTCKNFVCPFHAWTYTLDGALTRSKHHKHMKDFNPEEHSLLPLDVAIAGPWILVQMPNWGNKELPDAPYHNEAMAEQWPTSNGTADSKAIQEWVGEAAGLLKHHKVLTGDYKYMKRLEYDIECNWKAYIDNYLDGGYHIPYNHKELAASVDIDTYTTTCFSKGTFQTVDVRKVDDIRADAPQELYTLVYPNLLINRYGNWVDSFWVIPTGPTSCHITVDYWLAPEDAAQISEETLADNWVRTDVLQYEDVFLCEAVQKGLASGMFESGRYVAPQEEAPYHFHRLIHADLAAYEGTA
jgi:choline monooxygenase